MSTTKRRPAGKTRPRGGMTFDEARAIALALHGVEDGTSYGTPALKVSGKLLARLKEDGETLVVPIDLDARDALMRSEPETFYITDHYAGYPYVLVRLPKVERTMLAGLLEEAYRTVAPKRILQGAAKAKPTKVKPAARPAAAKSEPDGALDRVRAICLALPEGAEAEKHGRPGFEVRGKTFVMFMHNHHGDGRLAIWCKAPPGAQAALVEADPSRFFVPPYVGPRGWVGVRLEGKADWNAVEACVHDSYRMTAPKQLASRVG